MSTKRYIISCEDVRDNGFVDHNFEDTLLSSIIWRVQEIRIQAILGTELYEYCLDLIETADGDLSSIAEPYLTLLQTYVLPCVIPMVEERVCEHNPRITNKAIGDFSDEHLKASDKRGTTSLKQTFAKDSAHYRTLLIKYLCENSEEFSEYTFGQECVGYNPEKIKSSVRSMIFIKGGIKKRRNKDY